MRVAFVLAGLQAGGAERVIAQIAAQAVARGWNVTVIAFDDPGDPVYHPLHSAVALRRLGLPPSGAACSVRRVTALRRALREGAFDVVVSFLTKINVLTLLAGIGLGIPIVVSERNNPRRQAAHPVWNCAAAALYPRAAAVVVQTERGRGALPATARAKATVIPNPVEIPDFNEALATGQIFAAVGRLTHQKGFDLLIDAFARIADDTPGWRLVIWGDGPDRAALEDRRRALGLAERIEFPGSSATPRGWTGSASAFVLSSRYEGWPNALGEAMAAGLPVVAFDCDFGPADLIHDDATGLLVAAEDVSALAAAMRRIMLDGALRRRLASAGHARVARFAAAGVVDAWLSLLGSVARTQPGGSSTT